jgi:hypothetical protein
MKSALAILLGSLAALTVDAGAQPLSRLRGRVIDGRGQAVENAVVRIEAVSGFLGDPYAGQRTFDVTTDKKGEWALIGFKAGIWIFDASAEGRLPGAVALPITLLVGAGSGLGDVLPTWHPVLRLATPPASDEGDLLVDAADAARQGVKSAAMLPLRRLQSSANPDVLVAAGNICLAMRDPASALPFFRKALERRPESFEATLGVASSALMQRDYNLAAKSFDEARARTKDKDERSYITVAIGELNKVHVTYKAY